MKLSILSFLLLVIFSQTMYCADSGHNNQFPDDAFLLHLLDADSKMTRQAHISLCKKYLQGLKGQLEKDLQARNVTIKRYDTR